jgi:aryl-phospho-beta-D-glucosidase BglC (GH1 family)
MSANLSLRVFLLSAMLAGAAGFGLAAPLIIAPIAHARDMAPEMLAMSRSLFPAGSTVSGAAVGNIRADAATNLHTSPLAQLGRTGGYLETARWTSGRRAAESANTVTLQYSASVFRTPGQAAGAYSDAVASLWEAATPFWLRGSALGVYSVELGRKRREIDLLRYRGVLEFELSLRFGSSIQPGARSAALKRLAKAGSAASKLAGALGEANAPSGETGTFPSVYVAPWGTGPVVKSPSLMVAGSTGTPGAFRSATAPVSVRALNHPDIVPPGSLSRFVQTSTDGAGTDMYDVAALYPSAQSAAKGFKTLIGENDAEQTLHVSDLQPYLASTQRLARADGVRAWQGANESILVVRYQNVLMVLAQAGRVPSNLALLADRLGATVPTWLHANGTSVVDDAGLPVHLAGLNWYGAEEQDFIVGGLDYRPYGDILRSMAELGYNSIRLPFSNQLVEQNPIVTSHLAANPELQGLHALDILDRIIAYAGAVGISVILDNHRSDAGWSAQPNGLWYTDAYPDTAFQADWATMARRYAVNDVVVGADLRNEPHSGATWGDGNLATDWRAAAERAGNASLVQNPNLLIIVEGIQFYSGSPSSWWGGNLMGVAVSPVELSFSDGSSARSRLVYSAHDYGADNCGGGCPWFNQATTYASLAQTWDQYWGYIAADPSKSYAAPVWVGEFGTCNYQASCADDAAPGSQGQWFSSLIRYIAERHLGWSYWSANGTQSTGGARIYGALDWYGVFARDWAAPISFLHGALRGIQVDQSQASP